MCSMLPPNELLPNAVAVRHNNFVLQKAVNLGHVQIALGKVEQTRLSRDAGCHAQDFKMSARAFCVRESRSENELPKGSHI